MEGKRFFTKPEKNRFMKNIFFSKAQNEGKRRKSSIFQYK